MDLKELEIYKLSRELSIIAWNLYQNFEKDMKWSIGQQLIRAIDSVGANIAEGFGRFHWYDSINFYYYSRGSLSESLHWFELLYERKFIKGEDFDNIHKKVIILRIKLNNFINTTKNNAKK